MFNDYDSLCQMLGPPTSKRPTSPQAIFALWVDTVMPWGRVLRVKGGPALEQEGQDEAAQENGQWMESL